MSNADTNEQRKAFGKWLKRQLWRAELTQAEFARRAGATPSQVSFWARGERMPEPASCAQIALVLGMDLDEVLTRAGHRPAALDQDDEAVRNVVDIMHHLPDEEQREVEAFARFRLERYQRRARLKVGADTSPFDGDESRARCR